MRARRALLYMPATDWRKIEKAATELDVDSICMDLEDGTALNRKEEARVTVVKALRSLNFGAKEKLVRINQVGSGLEHDDLKTIVPARPDGIIIPKVSSAEDVRWVSQTIKELQHNTTHRPIYLLAIIENAQGVVNLREIASADSRLEALIFGAEDFTSDVGAIRTPESWEVFYARSAVVTHAAAFGLQAIDLLYTDFKNLDGLDAEALQGMQMGFAGKQAIHPNQIAPIQKAFTPTAEEITQAQRVLDAYQMHKGKGAFALDGKMVDMPVIRAAERVLARSRMN